MTEAVLGILAMMLCVVGAIGIIRWAALKIAAGSNAGRRVYAVMLQDEPDIQLQMLIDTIEWDNTLKSAKIYAVDGGLDEETSEYCKAVCNNSRITYISAHEAEALRGLF